MAQQDLVFKIKIDGTEREIKSLKDAKKARVELTNAFLAGDKDAAKSLALLQDKLDEVKDAARTLKTDGVEPLTGSFGLFKEGLGSGDFDKIKLGFKGVGAAMSAIPIFLLIEGFKLLIENFDEVVKFFDKGKTKADLMTEALEEQKKAFSTLSTTIGNQIKILEAQGNSEAKILQLKKELVAIGIKQAEGDILLQKQKIQDIILNDSLFESGQKLLAQQQRAIGNTAAAEAIEKSIAIEKQKRIKEASDALTQDYLTIQSLRTEDKINEIKDGKERNAAYKKHLEEKKALDAEFRQTQRDLDAENEKIKAQNLSDLQGELTGKKKEDLEVELGELQGTKELYAQQEKEDNVKSQEYLDDLNREGALKKIAWAKAGLQGASDLSDIFFQLQLNKTKGNAAAELEVRKKQFQVEKAFKVSQIIMDGIAGGIKAYSQNPLPSPIGIVSAALQGIASAAAIVKVLSTKFDAGSGGGGSSTAIPTGSMPNVNTTAPTTQAEPQQITTFTGNNNNNFNPTPIKTYVVETDMRESMDRQNKFKKESEFG